MLLTFTWPISLDLAVVDTVYCKAFGAYNIVVGPEHSCDVALTGSLKIQGRQGADATASYEQNARLRRHDRVVFAQKL